MEQNLAKNNLNRNHEVTQFQCEISLISDMVASLII